MDPEGVQTATTRILVVDDDQGIRDVLSFLLSKLGHRVTLAENGQQAFDLFSRDFFSLVMTDFCMPVMDGLALAERVKVRSPNTPIIMLTGSRIQEGAQRQCVDYIIPKPFRLDEVHEAVERALGSVRESRTRLNA